jgi:hypothetical protein
MNVARPTPKGWHIYRIEKNGMNLSPTLKACLLQAGVELPLGR